MSSTRKRTLADLLPGLHGQSTRNQSQVVTHHQSLRFTVSATGTVPIAFFRGTVQLLGVAFVPDAALAISGTNYWTLQVVDKGTNGSGATNLGSGLTTNTGGTALVADDEFDLFNQEPPATPQYQVAGDVLALAATITGAPGGLSGLVVVEYVPVF